MHTKGPWQVRRAGSPTDGEYDYGIGAVIGDKSYCIAEAFGRVGPNVRPDAAANAALIAAAPAMYETLKALLGTTPEERQNPGVYIPRVDAARAAIALAEGRQP